MSLFFSLCFPSWMIQLKCICLRHPPLLMEFCWLIKAKRMSTCIVLAQCGVFLWLGGLCIGKTGAQRVTQKKEEVTGSRVAAVQVFGRAHWFSRHSREKGPCQEQEIGNLGHKLCHSIHPLSLNLKFHIFFKFFQSHLKIYFLFWNLPSLQHPKKSPLLKEPSNKIITNL